MKSILIFILTLAFLSNIYAQTTAIPDPAFEQKLISLGIDTDGLNGQILNSSAAGVTTLHVHSSNISSLVGIEAFVNLVALKCDFNNLTSLNLYNNTTLGTLECSNNNLTSLNLSANTALTQMSCQSNNLTSLDLSANTALATLDCQYNNLTNLDLSANTLLNLFFCNFNNLTSLDLSANTHMSYLLCANNNLTNLDVRTNISLETLDCENNNLSNLNLSRNVDLWSLNCKNNFSYLKICVADVQTAISNTNFGGWEKDPSAVYSEHCYPLSVVGEVVIDANANCVMDGSEQRLLQELVKFEKLSDGTIYYFTTNNSLDKYWAYLDTGTYNITVIPNSFYWQVCPSNQQITIDTNYTVQTVNWTLQPLILCPMLDVDISAPFLRMTGGGSSYTISYCNQGTADAQNAYVEVDLDDDLNIVSSTIPMATQNGTIYTFNIGNVAVGNCGSFDIQVLVDTSAEVFQTHCTDVHIYPDSICMPIWTDAIVDGHVSCQNDTVFFYIENVGAAMLQPQPYSIIEDNIAMRIGNIQLGAGQSTTIAQAALAGKTYRIKVQQLAGFPALLGDSVFTLAIEGCNPLPNGSFNTGFITQFSNGHSSPFIAVDCQQNIASYDPNDKSAQPEGYGLLHYIEKNTALDYKVRFQNTGTDTAFNIVIVDTLSAYVDIASLQMGASSHNYTWQIEDGNVLKVSFLDIKLVDSVANEPLSHGFFRYRIEQKHNNPIGTVINNQAAIYFDYNPAILTNTTFHTVGQNFVITTVSVDKIYEEETNVTVFPNPFRSSATIKVEGKEYSELQLSIFDVMGRQVAQENTFSNNQLELTRGNLQAGIYFYQLQGDEKLISTGKIIVE